jgi:hypothetical protein
LSVEEILREFPSLRPAEVHDAMAEANPFSHHGHRGQELFRAGHMRVAWQEVMLHRPYGVEAQLICQLDLFQGFVKPLLDGPRDIQIRRCEFVEERELHLDSPSF